MNKLLYALLLLTLLKPITILAQQKKTAPTASNTEYLKGVTAETSKNYPEALKQYTIATKIGNHNAMYSLGYMYENGVGMDQNLGEAMKWYQKAAQKGNTDALVALGIIYLNDDKDEEAENCLKIAANKGNTDGMNMLGYFYFTREKYKEALPWLEKAAKKELPMALYYLGEMYENGYEVEENVEKGQTYYKRAAAKGEQNAIKKLKKQ